MMVWARRWWRWLLVGVAAMVAVLAWRGRWRGTRRLDAIVPDLTAAERIREAEETRAEAVRRAEDEAEDARKRAGLAELAARERYAADPEGLADYFRERAEKLGVTE